MGTRHLIAVHLDGKYPIAQYGQWDGYPDGQGREVLKFLREKMNREIFTDKLRNLTYEITDEDVDGLYASIGITLRKTDHGTFIGYEDAQRFGSVYPSLSRDTGSEILNYVQMATERVPMRNSLSFGGDGLFCEWAYVIDLDANRFEVYKGFFEKSGNPESRFSQFLDENSEYDPVRLIKSWSLSELPTVKEFLAEFKEPDEDEEEESEDE